MVIVGLTGSIATGKSVVSNRLKELGAHIIDYDVISKKVVEPGFPAWQDIVDYFGKDILNEDQTLDRARLASIVFNDEVKRKKLELFVHSQMHSEIERQEKTALKEDPNAIVVHDVPLLFETNAHERVEKVIVVHASEETQLRRLHERDGMSEEDGRSRIRTQLPTAEKIKRADFIIDNNGSIEETKQQVDEIYRTLRSLAQKK